MVSIKILDTLILDSGPILKNEPPVDSLLARSEHLLTVPNVISEIKDHRARTRVEAQLLPFLKLQTPKLSSLEFVSAFAKKSGDFSVLSKTDLEVLALTYEIECERNGDRHLRNAPGQNSPKKVSSKQAEYDAKGAQPTMDAVASEDTSTVNAIDEGAAHHFGETSLEPEQKLSTDQHMSNDINNLHISATHDGQHPSIEGQQPGEEPTNHSSPSTEVQDSDSDGSEGWITPSNLKKHQDQDLHGSSAPILQASNMQVACITTDFAMQNVLLQICLNLLSPSLQRIKNIKTYILRCHACFQQVRDTSKQFCPRCGNATLTRVSCSTNQKGDFRIHLKKNMEWHHRGDRYSVPKPVHGSANGKTAQGRGGGKGGWGQQLILTEDQKEYQRAVQGKDVGAKDLMDEDYLPGILSGRRDKASTRPKVGAGKNVNARKRAT